MKPNHRDSVLMRACFSKGSLAMPALEALGRDPELSVHLFRGRIPREDSFELEVSGPAPKIKEFFRLSDTWGASVAGSSPGDPSGNRHR